MLNITVNMKSAFFDREAVIDAVDNATRRAISKSLAFVRQAARRDMLRRRKRVATPGRPPSVHSKHPFATLRNVLFVYDHRTKSGIVGPVKLNQVNFTQNSTATVPQIHEFGATVYIREERWRADWGDTKWRRRDGRRRVNPAKIYRTRPARYPARPFMEPALVQENNRGNILSPWANVVRP